ASFVVSMTAAAIALSSSQEKTPMHVSQLTGQKWVDELLQGKWKGHPERFRRAMGMSQFVFRKLVLALRMHSNFKSSRYVSCEEQLA
ncbi:hypothetical protein C8R45DRAFT_768546, partial [Mycena sanguinolenta]